MVSERPLTLELDSVSFRYRRRREWLFDGLTLRFEPGCCYGITGPSGSGKSTLLYLLGLLLPASRGRILLGGDDVGQLRDAERSRLRGIHFGFIFQDAILDEDRSMLDNVVEGGLYGGLPREELEERARQLLERFEISEHGRFRLREISGGQAQRVGLCRALVADPAVILADEPTAHLDEANRDLVVGELRDRASADGNLVVIASHDPAVIAQTDERMDLVALVADLQRSAISR